MLTGTPCCRTNSHQFPTYSPGCATIFTFCVSQRRDMYIGHARLCVCRSVSVSVYLPALAANGRRKMSVFNKTNDVLIVDTFKNVFQTGSSEAFKPDVPEFGAIQKYMLHCQYSVIIRGPTNMYKILFCTCWLVLSRESV